MAVVRARSAPPYGLIAFVALFFIATAIAVLMYIQYGKTQTQLDELTKRYARVASPTEVNTVPPALSEPTQDKTGTAISTAVSQINGLKTLVAGGAAGTYMDTLGKAQSALKAAGHEKEPMADAISALTSERDALKRNLDEARTQLEAITTNVKTSGSEAANRVGALQKDVESLQTQLKAANDAIAKANESRDVMVGQGEQKLNTAVAETEQLKRTLVLQQDQAKAEQDRLQKVINDLKKERAGTRGGATLAAGDSDGQVVRVNAANSELWIDLGGASHITAGLTFTVYDPRTGVRFGTDELAAGKGSIEVIQPGSGNTPSLCRITHVNKGQAIQAHDLISNIVYHNTKERTTHFTIVGDFDLDGDGVSTADERQRLISLVTSWGGTVDDTVTTQTDYLVTGLAPAAAVVSATEGAATQQGSVGDERAKERARFDASIAEAKQLSIPALNANRFLSMIGYYSTTIVR